MSFLYWMLDIVHTETYVFQCTEMGKMFRPVRRNECKYSAHTLSEFESKHSKRKNTVGNTQSGDLSATEIMFRSHKRKHNEKNRKLSIGMLYLYDGSSSGGNGNDGGESWANPLMDRVVRNRQEYCGRHGYTLINANHLVDHTRPAAWSKLKAMDYYLSVRHSSDSSNGINSSSDSDRSSGSSDGDGVTGRNGSIHTNTVSDAGVSVGVGDSITTDTKHSSKGSSNNTKHGNKNTVKFDYILYIDMDVIIMDLDRELEDFLFFDTEKITLRDDLSVDLNKSEKISPETLPLSLPLPLPHFIMTEDWKGE